MEENGWIVNNEPYYTLIYMGAYTPIDMALVLGLIFARACIVNGPEYTFAIKN